MTNPHLRNQGSCGRRKHDGWRFHALLRAAVYRAVAFLQYSSWVLSDRARISLGHSNPKICTNTYGLKTRKWMVKRNKLVMRSSAYHGPNLNFDRCIPPHSWFGSSLKSSQCRWMITMALSDRKVHSVSLLGDSIEDICPALDDEYKQWIDMAEVRRYVNLCLLIHNSSLPT